MPHIACVNENDLSSGLQGVLLTTDCRPFGEEGEEDSAGAELPHAPMTRNQGIFSDRQLIRCWGLGYIAENTETQTVVLQYPF